jgi:hypothetical protein
MYATPTNALTALQDTAFHLTTGFFKVLSFYSIYLEQRGVQLYNVLIWRIHILRCSCDTEM